MNTPTKMLITANKVDLLILIVAASPVAREAAGLVLVPVREVVVEEDGP
jgi:hypothetical protein